ncbi:hypothetical protein ACVW1C_005027 [Bradyrhizobium sp. USDA 4011]
MSVCFDEPTIDDLLGDSLTEGLMQADGVDVAALARMLRGTASDRTAPGAQPPRAGTEWSRFNTTSGVRVNVTALSERSRNTTNRSK